MRDNQEMTIQGINAEKITFYRETNLKQTPIGKIPKTWRVVELGEVVEIFDSKRIPLSETERRNRRGPYPYCGANGIIDYIDDYIFDGEFLLLAEDGGSYGRFENSASYNEWKVLGKQSRTYN